MHKIINMVDYKYSRYSIFGKILIQQIFIQRLLCARNIVQEEIECKNGQ